MSEPDVLSSAKAPRPGATRTERAERTPQDRRNIVLLSDGTGNSAAKLNKTNVWRLYQALDLGGDDQIAFYDDGVGTSGFRPLQLLGGAFGWGLSRNVRDLYEFLCRHYRKGDQIYIFGFSRGAFTARTLAGLIGKCGILDHAETVPISRWLGLRRDEVLLDTHEGLKVGVKLAYKSYRRGYNDAPVAKIYRRLRDLILGPVPDPETFRRKYSIDRGAEQDEERVRIRFVGVWDTVGAVGVPVDELSSMIDNIFYPHRFPDQDLSDKVERACHAIAIDDERYTFHPVLWNERGTADSERISQVWFPGMHSDVGGGYPDNDLAEVALKWMIGQVRQDGKRDGGLRFNAHSLRAIEQRAQPLGKMHDSRRGLGVYYRYKPRRVASLCEDNENGVVIAEPKIHEAVFERIAANTTGYAPAGLPDHYRVVDERGRVSDPNPTTYETAEQRRSRLDLLDRARDHIFWRQVLYYMLVFVTLALVFMPYYWPPIPGAEPDDWLQTVLSKALDWLPALLPGFLGSWVGYWADTWTQSALSFSALAVVYVLLLWHSRTVTTNTLRLSELAWWHVKHVNEPDEAKPASPPVGPFERLANHLRNWKRLETFHRLSIKKAVPVLAIVFGLYVVSGAAYRVAFHFPSVGDGVCRQWLGAGETDDSEGLRRWQRGSRTVAIPFDTNIPCFDTGLNLRAGQRYVIELTDEKDWQDGGYAASSSGLSGLTHLVHPVFVAGVPTRRHVLLPWFTLIAEIGADSGYVLPINRNKVVIRPRQGGRLYLYVNDAINGLGSELGFDPDAINGFPIDEVERQNRRSSAWYAYYLNNAGSATLRVTRNP